MPTDSRRLTGPEETKSPYAYVKQKKKLQVLTGKRHDGRSPETLRPIFLKADVVSQARGSAYIEQDNTKVMCAVYGPREVGRKEDFSMKGIINCVFKYATFSCRYRRSYQQDSEEKDMSVQLLDALEPAVCMHKFPKAQVDIYVTVLQNDGSALAAAITCASVALANAGVDMYDLVAGCSVRIADNLVLVDPTESEEYKSQDDNPVNHGSVTLGYMPSLYQVSAITSKGEIEFEVIKKAINLCGNTSQTLYPVLQKCLNNSVTDKLHTKRNNSIQT
ncbi:exosome complex component MTR3-like [Mizuhopecten yessoensis]|uniref:exosome complex component MTR3-like n=1 Tax=Mizuhopecten yessoensis TaxID=6573 RepID=UPI000B457F38|nr:exosome complex component MTR3-like [Mizuhopecten yessoensis]